MALRGGVLRDSSLVVRQLMSVRHRLVASCAYLDAAGRPTAIADLHAHRC